MKPIKIIPLTCLIIFFSVNTKAQNYTASPTTNFGNNQIGLRFGEFSGLDFEHTYNRDVALRLDLMELYPLGRGMFEGLVQKNFPIKNGKGFVFFAGGGLFIATDYDRVYRADYPYKVYYLAPIPGITGTVGIDYYIPKAPIVIGLDVRPRFSFFGEDLWDAGISGRFIF